MPAGQVQLVRQESLQVVTWMKNPKHEYCVGVFSVPGESMHMDITDLAPLLLVSSVDLDIKRSVSTL